MGQIQRSDAGAGDGVAGAMPRGTAAPAAAAALGGVAAVARFAARVSNGGGAGRSLNLWPTEMR